MKLSREKVIHLSHVLLRRLQAPPPGVSVTLRAQPNDVRLRTVEAMLAFLRREEAVAEKARLKIRSQKRVIPEGSAEWDALYRRYYAEEMDRLRKVK